MVLKKAYVTHHTEKSFGLDKALTVKQCEQLADCDFIFNYEVEYVLYDNDLDRIVAYRKRGDTTDTIIK